MGRRVLAAIVVVALGASVHGASAGTSGAAATSGSPSTTVVPLYPGTTLLIGSQPASAHPDAARTPALARFETYVTGDRYEQVVRFYQAKLGLSPTTAHPKNLAATFPGQPIPARCEGRRAVFRMTPPPSTNAAQSVESRIFGQVLGGTNVVVSDFSVDPRTHQIVDQTSIVVLVYR